MKVLNSRIHGIVDYLVLIFLLASPTLFNLSEDIGFYMYILAGIHFLLTILTSFQYGLFKVIPFKIHGIIEYIVGIALIGAVFVHDLQGVDETFLLGFGIAVLVTAIITNYKS